MSSASTAGRAAALTAPVPPSTREELDRAVAAVARNKDRWPKVSIPERIRLVDGCLDGLRAHHERWVAAELEARGVDPESDVAGEEWATVSCVFRELHTLRQSLAELERHGRPQIPGTLRRAGANQVVAPVFPRTAMDRMVWAGIRAEVWMEPGVSREQVLADQAWAYREPPNPGRTVLILGAGNASLLVPADFLTKIFAENKVAVLKMNEVNEYLGPLIEAIYRPLIDAGVLRVCYGGAEQGGYLVAHELVDEVHITGSHHTYEAIVFGPGKQGQERKREGKPLLEKPITGELGTVSPVIIVPGVWSPSDLRHAASHVAAMLTFNAGFNCLTSRVIITHVGWPQRNAFLQTLRQTLAEVPCRKAFYPGAEARHQAFLDVHPEAYRCGEPGPGQLPWTLVGGVDAEQQDDICFTTEAFCGLFAETALDAPTPTDFIDHAVAFANGTLWGSLTSTVIVRPADLRYPAVREAVDRAQANLRYGTVGINLWGGTSYMLMTSSWGAFPGHTHADIQSGVGVVNNWLLFRQVQKTVSRGPFHSAIQPASTPGNLKLMKNVARLEASHSWGDLVRTGVAATLFDPWHTLVRMVE